MSKNVSGKENDKKSCNTCDEKKEFVEMSGRDAFDRSRVNFITLRKFGENSVQTSVPKNNRDEMHKPKNRKSRGVGRGTHLEYDREEGFIASPIYGEKKKHNGEDED